MPTPIAEAFLAVRPDTTGFAKLLRAQLLEQVASIKAPVVKVDVAINQASITAIQQKLRATPLVLPVELTIAPGSLTALQRLIRQSVAAQAPVPVNVTTKVIAAAAPAARAVASTGTAEARSVAVASGITAAEKAAANLALLQKQVGLASDDAAKRTFNYQQAVDRATQANNALANSEKFLRAQQAQANVEGIRTGEILRAQAREAQGLAQARVEVLAATRAGAAPVNTAAGVEEATKRAQLAVSDLNEAQVLLQSEIVQSNAALTRQAETLVRNRAAVLGDAEAVKASAIAQAEAAAAAQASAAASEAAAAALANAAKLHAGVGSAASAGATELESATRGLSQAERANAASAKALEAALATGNEAMIAQATSTHAATAALIEHHAAAQADAKQSQQLLPTQTAIARVQGLVGKANDPLGVTAIEQAKRAATSAAAAGNALQEVQAKIASGALLVTEAEAKEVAALAASVPVLEAQTQARYADAKAAAVQAQEINQAARGAAATSATFLGLRGAVLSSSAPFLAATIAITALSKILGSAGQLQESLHTFQAATGATAEQMKAVDALAIKLGGDITLPATSASDAANAMTELAKAGLTVADSMTAARGALELAAAANIKATDAAAATASILNQFQLAGKQASQVTDLLAGASISAQGSIQDFVEGFRALGPTAHQAGVDVSRTAALLTELGKAGLAGAFGGTSLKTFLLDLVPASKAAADAQQNLGVHLNEQKSIGEQLPRLINEYVKGLEKLGPAEQTAALRTIFGTRGIQAAAVVFGEGTDKLIGLQNELSKAGFGATLTAARMNGLTGAADALGSSTQTLGTTLGGFLLPAMTAITHGATNIVNALSAVAEAVKPLADATRIIGKIPGGGDALATLGLTIVAAKGLEAAWGKVALAAVKAAASQNASLKATAGVVDETGTLVAQEGVLVGELRTELGLREGIVAVTGRQAVAQLTTNRLALIQKGILSQTTLALGLGVGASIAGQAVPGEAGGILGAAGTGAILGSFLPIPGGPLVGAGVGAGAGVVLKLFSDAKAASDRQAAEAKSAWQKLTFQEQQAFLRINFPNLADPNASPFDIRGLLESSKPDTTRNAGRGGVVTIPGQTAAEFVQQQGGFNIPASAIANAKKILQQTLGPDLTGQIPGGLDRAHFFFDQLAQNFVSITTSANSAVSVIPGLNAAVTKFTVGLASLTGNFGPAIHAVTGSIASLQKQETAIQTALSALAPDFSGFVIKGKDRVDKLNQAAKIVQQILTAQQQLLGLINESFKVPEARATLAQTQAQGTKSFADNIAADQQAIQTENDKLAKLQAANAAHPGSIAVADILAQRTAVATATNQLTTDQAAQQTANEKAVADALSAQEAGLRFAADAAGNLGVSEDKLVKFLEVQVNKSKKNTVAFWNAENALSAEEKKQADAIKASQQLTVDLAQSAIDARKSAAALTDTKADDVLADRAEVRLVQHEIDIAIAAQKKLKSGTDEWKKAQIAINGLIAQKNQALGTLKSDLNGGSGGFSLNDLFQESIKQLQEFGSNISSTVTTGGGARAALAGGILAQNTAMSPADMAKLEKTAETNGLLKNILEAIRENSRPPVAGRGAPDPVGAAGFATAVHNRRLVGLGG